MFHVGASTPANRQSLAYQRCDIIYPTGADGSFPDFELIAQSSEPFLKIFFQKNARKNANNAAKRRKMAQKRPKPSGHAQLLALRRQSSTPTSDVGANFKRLPAIASLSAIASQRRRMGGGGLNPRLARASFRFRCQKTARQIRLFAPILLGIYPEIIRSPSSYQLPCGSRDERRQPRFGLYQPFLDFQEVCCRQTNL